MSKKVIAVAAAAVLAVGVSILGAVALVRSDRPTTTAAPADTWTTPSEQTKPKEPKTLAAAQDAAQKGWDRFTTGDYGGSYDTLESKFRASIGKADYVKLFTACNTNLGSQQGFAVTITDPRWANPQKTRVTITIKALFATATRDMVYEDGAWFQAATAESKQIVATWKKSGVQAAVDKHCEPEA